MLPVFPASGSTLPSKSILPPPPQSINSVQEKKRNTIFYAAFVFCIGAVVMFLGVYFHYFLIDKIDKDLDAEMIVDSTTHKNFNDWLTNQDSHDATEYAYITVFNVTNLSDVLLGRPPRLQEIGPYVYKVNRIKLAAEFGSTEYIYGMKEGDIARYKEYKHYVFDSSKSFPGAEPEKDRIISASMYYLSLINRTDGYLNGARLFEPFTIQELVWGYQREHPSKGLSEYKFLWNLTSPEECLNSSHYQAQRTGKKSRQFIKNQVLWGDSTFCMIEGKHCWKCPARIEGHDISQFHFSTRKKDSLGVWFPNALRAVAFAHEGDANQRHRGVDTLRFRVKRETFLNQEEYPPNRKYYHTRPSGLMNITLSYSRLPIWLSQPHFYDGTQELYTTLNHGLSPKREIHSSFIDVEPNTGLNIMSALRYQLNFEIKQEANASVPSEYQSIQETIYLPALWVEEKMEASKEQTDDIKTDVYFVQDLSLGLLIAGSVIGALLMIGSAFYMYLDQRKQTRIELLDTSSETEVLIY